MIETTGTVIDGVIQLNEPIDLPDKTRVYVQIELIENAASAHPPTPFEQFSKLLEEHPIHSDGQRYTRDELHER